MAAIVERLEREVWAKDPNHALNLVWKAEVHHILFTRTLGPKCLGFYVAKIRADAKIVVIMPAFDFIVVLGSKPSTSTWRFPKHVYDSLDKAANLYERGLTSAIAVSGYEALSFAKNHIHQPSSEAAMMTNYLLKCGVPPHAIVQENESEDTISNLYFLKHKVFKPRHARKLLFILADFREPRVTYLAKKILGEEFIVGFQIIRTASNDRHLHEKQTLARTKKYLDYVRNGDDEAIKSMFYGHPFYTGPRPELSNK